MNSIKVTLYKLRFKIEDHIRYAIVEKNQDEITIFTSNGMMTYTMDEVNEMYDIIEIKKDVDVKEIFAKLF